MVQAFFVDSSLSVRVLAFCGVFRYNSQYLYHGTVATTKMQIQISGLFRKILYHGSYLEYSKMETNVSIRIFKCRSRILSPSFNFRKGNRGR